MTSTELELRQWAYQWVSMHPVLRNVELPEQIEAAETLAMWALYGSGATPYQQAPEGVS